MAYTVTTPTVSIPAAAGRETVLRGFTVRGGSGKLRGDRTYGAGVFIEGSPTVSHNRIVQNTLRAAAYSPWQGYIVIQHAHSGSGIFSASGSPLIANNLIAGNAGGMGAVACEGGAPELVNNTIVDNGDPFAVRLETGCKAMVANNIVAFNPGTGVAAFDGDALAPGNAVLRHNLVHGQTQNYQGSQTRRGWMATSAPTRSLRTGRAGITG
jgi:hypothetical protein